MKLKKFDSLNSRISRTNAATIRFHCKGNTSISKKAVDEIGLKDGDKISICQDEDDPNDFYLVTNDPDGFTLRASTGDGLNFNCATVFKTLAGIFDGDFKSIGCKLATTPTSFNGSDVLTKKQKLYAIITASAVFSEIKSETNS